MKRLPQTRLRTFFLWFFCAAVGLTCGTAPETADQATLRQLLTGHVANLNLHYALLTAGATAMVIGLAHQSRKLSKAEIGRDHSKFIFAWRFAVCWRVLVAGIIGVCLLGHVFISRQIVHLPERTDLLLYEIFPDQLLLLCVVVVLVDSVRRWQPGNARGRRFWFDALGWLLGITAALFIWPDSGMVTNLVDIAVRGIEASHPLKFQRPGALPTQTEQFHLFWLSLAAMFAVLLAASLIALATRGKRPNWVTAGTWLVGCGLLASAAIFVTWFYWIEFPRRSPDMASVGFASNWVDWLAGTILGGIIVTACAYRLAVLDEEVRLSWPQSVNNDRIALHESPLWFAVLFGSAAVYFVQSFSEVGSWLNLLSVRGALEILASMLQSPAIYVVIAISALSLQLLWLRWRRRTDAVDWQLRGVSRMRFAWSCLALAMLAVVGLPTVAIYCVTFWSGPWYLYGP